MPKHRAPNPELDPLADRLLVGARGSLAANLRERRASAHLTQEQLAELVGLSTNYVQLLERGDPPGNPTLRVLALVAHALGCELAELVVSRQEPPRSPPGRPRRATVE